ncbi:ATP-binding protein [Aliikangiella sp. IMCC44359]|uniref:ATP-binding protein n=1 Tax=Aliikangiella sp. IMCC44359 TaxID=3459125 RepID=UPI00403AE35C
MSLSLSNRLFIRLYLIIVASVILIGWSVDYLWQSHHTTNQDTFNHEEVLLLATKLIETAPPEKYSDILKSINQISPHQLTLLSNEQIQADELKISLANGEIITLQNGDNEYVSYKQLNNSDQLISIDVHMQPEKNSAKYIWLLIFYLLIAGIVYLWTLPLNRDLKILEKAASSFADSKWEANVDVSKHSPVKHLANAYNNLLIRIKQLVNDQQEMSHAISHELRTPLARIKFSIEMANNSHDIEMIQEQLDSITEDINEIQQLVDELLSYASLEKSSTVANYEKGNIESLILTLVEKLQRNSPDKKLTYEIKSSNNNIYCDSYLIERGLQNLIINAQKYCHSKVHITFTQINNTNQLLIDDDGEGIPEFERIRIFDSFVRLQSQQKTYKGFGLGLAIVKRVAQLHEGNVFIHESPMGGARFGIEWPNTITQ